jgi:NRAMP (natural resistance-associated macrophage protein)-like metal ion transporter
VSDSSSPTETDPRPVGWGRRLRSWFALLGPGLITGASDDDPSGIATYAQVGAQFGYGLSWVMLFSFPLMAAIQEISARIGRVTGQGIAGNIRDHYPAPLVRGVVGLLLVANIINLGADLGAMADALKLLIGGSARLYAGGFALLCVSLEIFCRYQSYVAVLKWMTSALLAYAAVAFVVEVPWGHVLFSTLVPHLAWGRDELVALVALLGTTISPYMFFWQASQEAEDEHERPGAMPLLEAPEQARGEMRRIRFDTYIGMGFSNVIALFIIVTAAATLNAHGVTDIRTSAQAAEALRPLAGDFSFALFAAGIVGTGMLAVPVLAGSAAYALAETLGWPSGLARTPRQAKSFYGTIAAATLVGIGVDLVGLDPIKALFWSAVLNGVVAVPLMVMMMLMTARRAVMGAFTLPPALAVLGWLSTLTMAATVAAMVVTW